MNYFERLKDIREDNEQSQEQISGILKINQTQYSRYELGKNMMGVDKYIELAKHYNISLDYLTGIINTPRALFPENDNEPETLTLKQKKLLMAYSKHKELQDVIDKILDL